jgi:hypothetical protein
LRARQAATVFACQRGDEEYLEDYDEAARECGLQSRP